MNLIQNSIFQTKLGKSNERYIVILCDNTMCIVHRPIFKIDDSGSPQRRIVVIQCDSGHMIGDLIACARYRIYDLKARADKDQITHVLFIIHLSVLPNQVTGSSFVGFQGNPWVSAHIDDLRPTADNLVATQQAIGVPISDLFHGTYMPSYYNRLQSDEKEEEGSDMEEEEDKMEEGDNEEGSDFEEREDSMKSGDDFSSISTDESDSESEGEERGKVGTKVPKRWVERVRDEMETDLQSEEQSEMEVIDIEGDELLYGDILSKDSAAIGANITKDMYKSEKKPLIPLAPHLLGNDTKLGVPTPHVPEKVVLKSPLFKRLHDCIQAAASRLKDFTTKRSTKRVEILVHLVPRELPPKPGKSQLQSSYHYW